MTTTETVTPTRQQKRKALRDAIKDYDRVVKTKEFADMQKYFNLLSKEDFELLEKDEHTSEAATTKYKRFTDDMKTFCEIESRVDYCKGLFPVKEED